METPFGNVTVDIGPPYDELKIVNLMLRVAQDYAQHRGEKIITDSTIREVAENVCAEFADENAVIFASNGTRKLTGINPVIQQFWKARRENPAHHTMSLDETAEDKVIEIIKLLKAINGETEVNASDAFGTVNVLRATVASMESRLSKTLLGQPQVIEDICKSMISDAIHASENKPRIYLMAGPSGTGKSLAARLIHEEIREPLDAEVPKVFDMSAMVNPNHALELFGSASNYSDACAGKLTQYLQKNPEATVVLDNFDLSHPNVQNNFVLLFSRGVLIDEFGIQVRGETINEVDCSRATFVFITRAASDKLADPDFLDALDREPDKATTSLIDALSQVDSTACRAEGLKAIPSALLSELARETVLWFKPLSLDALRAIASKTIDNFKVNVKRNMSINVSVAGSDIVTAACLQFGDSLNGTTVATKQITDFVFAKFFEELRNGSHPSLKKAVVRTTPKFKEELAELMTLLDADDPVRDLVRKQRRLDFDIAVRHTKDSVIVTWKKPRWKTLTRASDIGVTGGLQITPPDVCFDDVAGHVDAKKQLLELASLLRSPEPLIERGVALPKGMLLHGQPGTGKTMLARAFAREAELPFIAVTGPDMLSVDSISKTFARARYYGPAILFIDECEVFGSREPGGEGNPIIINQLLAELDGFKGANPKMGVFVIMATNYPRKLDPAIVRPGRIDRIVAVTSLDAEAREYFLQKLVKIPGGRKLNIDALVKITAGMTGAQLAGLQREIALDMLRKGQQRITQDDVVEMIEFLRFGGRRERRVTPEQKRLTAVHEAGHAVVTHVLVPGVSVNSVTIIARDRYEGATHFGIDGNNAEQDAVQVRGLIGGALAGRVAQQVLICENSLDTGAEDDIAKATELAMKAVMTWGLDPVIGNRCVNLKTTSKSLIDERVKAWIDEGTASARKTIEENRALVESLVERLLTEYTVRDPFAPTTKGGVGHG